MKDLSGTTLGQYKILRKLGSGGMATVYKAHEMSLNRVVALKVIAEHLTEDESFLERFQREARAAAALNHPNIVQIYAIGEDQGIHWFTMEYVKGRSVEEILKEEGFFTAARATPIIRQVAEALAVAHEAGIVHRDIKPANIMIDTVGRVKVADFGIAQVADAGTKLTREGFLVGTPEYISPEQCRGEHLDGRTDIYSLGVTFFQMLTGRTPFEADTPAALVLQITEGKVPSVTDLNPTIAPDIRRIVARMMHIDRDERFRTAEDLIASLKNADVSVTTPQRRPGATVSMDDAEAAEAPTRQADGDDADKTVALGAGAGAAAGRTEVTGDEPGPTEVVSAESGAGEPEKTEVMSAESEAPATSGQPSGPASPGAPTKESAAIASEPSTGEARQKDEEGTAAARSEEARQPQDAAADADAARRAAGRRNAYIALAAMLLLAIAAGAWALLGGDSVDPGLATDAGAVTGELSATAGEDPATDGGEAARGQESGEAGQDRDPATAGQDQEPLGTGQEADAGGGTPVADTRPEESPTADAAQAGVAGGGASAVDPGSQPADARSGGAASGEGAAATEPTVGGPQAPTRQAVANEPSVPAPSPDSLAVTVSGDLEHGNMIGAWLESRARDRGFELIDWPTVSDRPLEQVARFHLAATTELVGSDRLEYFGQSTTQYTASLTFRVVDPATGNTLAGPVSEMVKYTSTNAEQNLRAATRQLSDQLLRDLRQSGR